MKTRKITIRPEYSAQRRSHRPNPALGMAIRAVGLSGDHVGGIADLGCGKLRHYKVLAPKAGKLFLVDTPEQLYSPHVDGGVRYTIPGVAARASRRGRRVYVMPFSH